MIGDQWAKFYLTGISHLPTVNRCEKGSQWSKICVTGIKDARKQAAGQWTELCVTGINHLLAVKGYKNVSWWSVHKIWHETNYQWSRDMKKQAGGQWTELSTTEINHFL